MNTNQLPEPEKVFSGIFENKDSRFQPHSKGFNAFFNAFVSVIALSLSRQDPNKPRYNQGASAFDLVPLYGATPQETNLVRSKDGRGMLAPDCFFDPNISKYPSAVAALLVLWNRNHNYIARQLLFLNERKTWFDPTLHEPLDEAHKTAVGEQDDEIFEQARRINCIQFKNTIQIDFLEVIQGGEVRTTESKLDLRKYALQGSKREDPALGASFQSLYQQWTPFLSEGETIFYEQQLLGFEGSANNPDPKTRNFKDLERGPNWRFKDEDLTRILVNATQDLAGNGTVVGSRLLLRSLEKTRTLNGPSLNSFRTLVGLDEYKNFLNWTADSRISENAATIYGGINGLEIYVGLLAEEPKGILGATLSKGLLADIATFIECDPRFNIDFDEKFLSTWGKKDSNPKNPPLNGAFGAWIPRLLQRNLPHNYTHDSVFSLFPLFHPDIVKESLEHLAATKKLKDFNLKDYQFKPPHTSPIRIINSKDAIHHIFRHPEKYSVLYSEDISFVSNGYGFFIGRDDPKLHDKDLMMTMFTLHPDKGASRRYADFFAKTAAKFISDAQTNAKGADNGIVEVDIVKEVINKTCTRWVCQTLCGIDQFGQPPEIVEEPLDHYPFPKRTFVLCSRKMHSWLDKISRVAFSEKPKSEEEWHTSFGHLYALVFRNGDPQTGWTTRQEAKKASQELFQCIEDRMQNLKIAPRYLTVHYFTGKTLFENWILHYFDKAKKDAIAAQEFVFRLLVEYFKGQNIPQFNSAVFLERMIKASRRPEFALGRATLDNQDLANLAAQVMEDDKNGDFKGWKGVTADVFRIIQREDALQKKRVVANIVGLSMATSIHYAQACALAVDFYLDNKREIEYKEICRLVALDEEEAVKEEADAKIKGYIREAQRIGQPFGIWRQAKEDDTILSPDGSLSIKRGDRIYVDFGAFHTSDEFPQPLEVDLQRKVSSLQGLGLHKCPGMSFVDNTMPELFKAVFRLKNLKRTAGEEGRIVRIQGHSPTLPSHPRLFWDTAGVSAYPRTLKVTFVPEVEPLSVPKAIDTNGVADHPSATVRMVSSISRLFMTVLVLLRIKPQPEGDEPQSHIESSEKPRNLQQIFRRRRRLSKIPLNDESRRRLRVVMNTVLFTIILLFFGLQIFRIIRFIGRSLGLIKVKVPRILPKASDVKHVHIPCPKPINFEPNNPLRIAEFAPGPDGEPAPFTYVLDDPRSHKLSFVDIDEKDTRVSFFVDDELRAISTDFVSNKSLSCGEDIGLCISEDFSRGGVMVPGGKHTVRVEYQGDDFYPNTTQINWGDEKFRRFMYWRDWCD